MALLRVTGRSRVPGDKSISHRALILAPLAAGRSRIRGIPRSGDVASTAAALRALGAAVPALTGELMVHGRGIRSLSAGTSPLDCGNSGTTARLLAGVCAAHPFETTFTGDESLSRRPMERVARPLGAMGARVRLSPTGGLPMVVHGGTLRSVHWRPDAASAQVKSAVLLAALCAGVDAEVTEPYPSRDHTERMLRQMGADVAWSAGHAVLRPSRALQPFDLEIPGDPSSAAFLVGLALLASGGELMLESVLLNPTRTGYLHVLRRMGAEIELAERRTIFGEEVGTIIARPSTLRGTAIAAAEIPSLIDELPLIGCLAARAEGETRVSGAQELRLKETDRLDAVARNLRALGAEATALTDGFVIRGSDVPLAGRVVTQGDHRIAMAFGLLAALPGNRIVVDDPACAGISYPGFWDDVARISGRAARSREPSMSEPGGGGRR